MKKKSYKSHSLKTFLIYSYLVVLLIIFSLAIKSFYVFQENKFYDDNITIAVSNGDKVRAVIGIDKERDVVSVLRIKRGEFPSDSLWYDLGILIDANIYINDNISQYTPEEIIKTVLINSDKTDTDLTIFDKLKLYASDKIKNYNPDDDYEIERSELTVDNEEKIKDLFTDNMILEEGATIQIVNSTDIPGLGQRLEKAVVNKGGNVVSVTNKEKLEKKSSIKTSLNKSYTVRKLERILFIDSAELTGKSVADIVIVIGEDMQKFSNF